MKGLEKKIIDTVNCNFNLRGGTKIKVYLTFILKTIVSNSTCRSIRITRT